MCVCVYTHTHTQTHFFSKLIYPVLRHTSAISYVMLVSTTISQLKNMFIKYTIIPVKIKDKV